LRGGGEKGLGRGWGGGGWGGGEERTMRRGEAQEEVPFKFRKGRKKLRQGLFFSSQNGKSKKGWGIGA